MSPRPRPARSPRSASSFPVLFALALAPVLAACGGERAPAVWVGAASGTDVVVAFAEQDDALVAYVCGGAETFASHSRWYDGTLDGSAFTAKSDGWSLAGDLDSVEGASGKVTTPWGDELPFTAKPVEAGAPDGVEGLFAVEDSGCRTGVVVQTGANGEPWVQGTWCDDGGLFAQVTPVLPIELTASGLRVRVERAALGLDDIELYAVPVLAR